MQRYQNNIQDQFGNAISGVTVTVRTNPGGVLATIYSDDGVSAKSNPFTNDSDGELFFYAANGRYNVELSGGVTETITDLRLLDLLTTSGNTDVIGDIVTATPPTTEAITAQTTFWDLDKTDTVAQIGFNGSNTIRIANRMHGGLVQLNAEDSGGVARNLFSGNPGGSFTCYHAGGVVLTSIATGLQVRSSTDNNPTLQWYQDDGTTRNFFISAIAASGVTLGSELHGLPVNITGEDAGGVVRTLLTADPDSSFNGYHNGGLRFSTNTTGRFLVHSDGDTDTEQRGVNLAHLDGTVRGSFGYLTDGVLTIRNLVHGSGVLITAEDTGGTARTILSADPDSTTILRADTNLSLQVAAATLALEATAGAQVDLYYNGGIKLRTAEESTADIGMGAEVRHNDDAYYPVGMNVAPEDATLDSGNLTLSQAHIGKMLTYNTATARSLILNNVADIKVGALCSLIVGPSAGTLTGDGGTGVVLNWWNGTGWTATAAAGNITIGVGQYTIWKETDTLYWISGPTLS